MSEAQPSRKTGGHAFGRRFQQLSNTASEGELCIYQSHGIRRFSEASMRYDSHAACTRCVAAAREGRLSFDINRLLRKWRKKALEFWSLVDIGAPDECWEWKGTINPRTKQPQFPWRRAGIASSPQHHPQRVAMWFTWGDLGFTGVKTTCGNRYCCNPFHLIPQKVGVFVDQDSYLESFELACEIHTLKQQVHDYQVEKAIKIQLEADRQTDLDARNDLVLNPTTDFGKKFEAVLTDMLEGRHITQTESTDRSLFRQQPVDNELDIKEDDDEPTEF